MSAPTDEGVISLTPLASKKSPTLSSFNPEKLLPEEFIDPEPPDSVESHKDMSSPSDSGVSAVFEPADEAAEHTLTEHTEHTEHTNSPDEPAQFDLKPPPPSVSAANGESLHDRLYSADHLNVILRDPNLNARFSNFIQTHRPYLVPVLSRYLEVQKAKSAIDYANAVAEHIPPLGSDSAPSTPAAFLDSKFESRSRRAEEKLTSDALPGYITRRLVQLVTECLVKEITGNNAPIMQEMVHGLAEVYCMTDPSLPDNPIVYSSAGFYKTTQYGREYVIGRNCRFLQGPKTAQHSVSRLSQALSSGTEVCETILNYRRDGTPFINLLMMAPLYDNKGRVRYFIGCQIDITSLIEGGRGLESFQRLLAQDRAESRFGSESGKSTMKALTELGTLLSKEEMEAVRRREVEHTESGRTTPARPATARRFIGMDDPLERNLWPAAHYGPSGRLPGVYQNYLLVRPYPSLRITFTSPALRIPGLLQSKFMDRIGGPQSVRDGILESLTEGITVTAKISWLTGASNQEEGSGLEGKARWIHCTPLLGSDEKVGVWMIVMIEREIITGSLNAHSKTMPTREATLSRRPSGQKSKPSNSVSEQRREDSKLYAQYLREGKLRSPDSSSSRHISINPTPILSPDEGMLDL